MDFNMLISTLIGGGLALLSLLQMTGAIAVNRKANFYFGIFCLLWASFWLDEMIDPDFLAANQVLSILLKIAQFLVGMVFFVSVRFYTNPDFRFSKTDLKLLIAPAIFLTLLLNRAASTELTYNLVYLILFLGHSLAYVLLAYATIRKHEKTVELFSSDTQSIDLKWIKYIIYSFLLSLLIVIVYNVFQMRQPLNIFINFYLLAVVYLVAFCSIRQKEIFPRGLDIEETINAVATDDGDTIRKTKLMDDAELDRTKINLIDLIENEKLYLDSELNLLKLADRMRISTHQLSYVINNGVGENFFHFINKYRVRNAEELLTNENYDHLTIVAVGFDSGFNSKTAFNTTFKKITSFTPTELRKMRSAFQTAESTL